MRAARGTVRVVSAFVVPEPRLQRVHDLTGMEVFQCDKMGVGRRFFDTVVVKGTFLLAPGVLRRAPQQSPLVLADDYWDTVAPERSSVRHAGEVLLYKPSTDVLVTGTLVAPHGRRRPAWEASVRVHDGDDTLALAHARVTGPRWWTWDDARAWALTEPADTDHVPVRYEFAYGGAFPDPRQREGDVALDWVTHRANPCGTGFVNPDTLDRATPVPAPRWESPSHPVTALNREVPVAGFGPIARHWSQRLPYAGTYDDAWERQALDDIARGVPADYAADFDVRFFQCAHPSLVTSRPLAGHETITLTGLRADPDALRMTPGAVRVMARMLDGSGSWSEEPMRLDTVHIDLDRALVHLCWRVTLDHARDVRTLLCLTEEPP